MAEAWQYVQGRELGQAWALLEEYCDFRRLASHRLKLDEQLQHANVPLTHVPWKSMVRAVLTQQLFYDQELKEMNKCLADDLASSEVVLNDTTEVPENLTETWFEVDQLKGLFQRAMQILPQDQKERRAMFNQILGYPKGYSDHESGLGMGIPDEEPWDLARVLSTDEQQRMSTGDLIELSGNRLHNAFYIYRLPQKGIWAQIQQMWSDHRVTKFTFDHSPSSTNDELILVPAMDEYGYGVPYLFATRPTELLSTETQHKYVDINCPHIAALTENPTIALVLKNLDARLKDPLYRDAYMKEEMSIEPDRFPQEYVAMVTINEGPSENVLWTQRAHHDGQRTATDLNDNREIFFSRRILEAEEQYR